MSRVVVKCATPQPHPLLPVAVPREPPAAGPGAECPDSKQRNTMKGKDQGVRARRMLLYHVPRRTGARGFTRGSWLGARGARVGGGEEIVIEGTERNGERCW